MALKSILKSLSPDQKKSIAKKEQQIAKLVMEIYEEGFPKITPIHPFVLVRVLPKEHIVGSILLPETAQNKPVYEAIVIKTWEPYDEVRRVKHLDGMAGYDEVTVHHECILQPGMRIAYPHYEGIAFPIGDDQYYKMIREGNDQNQYPYMSVLGILDYEGDIEAQTQIRKAMQKIYSITTSGVSESRGAQ